MTTTIKVSDWTWEQLKNKKKRGQSFNNVLETMLEKDSIEKDCSKEIVNNNWRRDI